MDHAFLATIPYLRDLKDAERASLMHCIAPVGVAPEGGILFDVGEASDGAYIVRAGELHVELPLPDGTHRLVARLGQGTLVGELSLIEHTPRTMRVRVMPGSQLYRIDRVRFTAMRQAGNLAAYKVIRSVTMTMCDRLRDTNMRIEERWQGRSSTTGDVSIASLQTEVKMSAWDRLRRLFGEGLSMAIDAHALTSLKLFSALSPDELRTLASVMQPASYLPDEQIFAQGDKAWCCYVILDGSVRIVGAGAEAASRTFAVLEAGELFGEVALIDGGRRSAGCIAGPDGAELARLARPEFDLIFEAGNRFAFKLMDLIASQLTHRLEQAATKLRAMAVAER